MASRRVKEQETREERPVDDYVSQGVRQYTQLLESADPKAIAIYLALWQASHVQALANARAIDSLDLPVSVSGTRLTVLRTLYFAPGRQLALKDISQTTGISPAMVTHLIDGLSRGGLVRLAGSPDDRRVKLAVLTPAGEDAFETVLPVIDRRMTEACAGWSEDEKDQLLALLQRLC
jgi:DNA-binding MarR family transcriptional regulator